MKRLSLIVLLLALAIAASVRADRNSADLSVAGVSTPMLNGDGNLNPTPVSDVNPLESPGAGAEKYERAITQNDVPFACSPCMGTTRSGFLTWLHGFQIVSIDVAAWTRTPW